MNRTIKFRGKRVDTGEWVYGSYVFHPNGWHRIYYQPFDEARSNTYQFVTPETVGQFTGLLDKDGKEIYEADVVSDGFKNLAIKFIGGSFGTWDGKALTTYSTSWRVLGNIHDNPKLSEDKA